MKQAIKVLESHVQKLNGALQTAEQNLEEPEMLCDIEFATNDIININGLITEMKSAINILNQHK